MNGGGKDDRRPGRSGWRSTAVRDLFYIGLAGALLFAVAAAYRYDFPMLAKPPVVFSIIILWGLAGGFFYTCRRWRESRLALAGRDLRIARYKTRIENRKDKAGYQARTQRLSHIGNWRLDIEGNRLNWSDETLAIFGLDPENDPPSYERYLKIIHPADRPVVEQAVAACLRERTIYTIDYRILTPDGETRNIFEQNQPIIENDKVIGITGSITDVSARKLAEEGIYEQYGMLQFLIDAIPIPVFHKDENGVFESCNKAYEDFFGVSKAVVIGNTVYEFLSERQAIEADHADRSLIRLGCALTYEAQEVDSEGRKSNVIYYKTPLTKPDGSPGGIIAAMLDITERKHMEAALRESEKRFRIIAESSSDWFWETDRDHKFTYMSERYEEIAGFTPESVFGKTRMDKAVAVELEEDKGDWRRHIADLEAHRPFRDFVYLFKANDGTERSLKVSGIPIFGEDGAFAGYRGSGTDVSDNIRIEKALRESEQRHRDFAANVAHELRTPLAVMRVNLDNLEDTKAIKSLRHDVDSMSRMVTQLLAATRIETHAAADFFVGVNLAEVCRNVATLLAPIAIKEQRSIEVIGGEVPLIIQGIPESLEQAVRNLAENAIRYSSRGSIITLKLGRPGEIPEVSVIDRGRGIPEEQREIIFERFLRADRRTGGAGLGLSIVKRTVDIHKGKIEITDTPSGGATFTIRFPEHGGPPPTEK